MRVRQLEYFLAVCETWSFTRAAERLFIAQPSLSQQIKALEADLRVALFVRSPHGLRLTPAGQAFVPEAKAILDAVAHAREVIQDHATGNRGVLEILAVRSLATGVLPAAVGAWNAAFPNVEVEIHDFQHQEAMDETFRDGRGDFAVGLRSPAGEAHTTILGYEELLLVCPKGSPLAAVEAVSLADLASSTWILFDRTKGLTRLVVELCREAGFRPDVAVWTGQIETAIELVSDGVGITLIPHDMFRAHAGLLARPLSPRVLREVCVYLRPNRTTLVNRCVQVLLQVDLPLVKGSQLPAGAIIT